jgi:hypothetical protein
MKQRGRKSAQSLTVAQVQSIPRAAPPSDLSAYEAECWTTVVNTKPADWFTADTLPLLRSYVRHCYQAKKIDDEMDKIIERPFVDEGAKYKGEDLYIGDLFEKLQKMRERESAKIMALARSMRLTQQAQIHPETAGTSRNKGSKGSAVWEFE